MPEIVSYMPSPLNPPPLPLCCRYAFTALLPLRVSLRRELGEWLVARGVVGAALALFEALELWDSLIVCYRLLDKKIQVGAGWRAGGREG